MPSVSPAQKRTMAAADHNPEFAKKMGIPQSVAHEFVLADMGRKLGPIKKAPKVKRKP